MPDGPGQPTKYKKDYCQIAKALCDLGATDVQVAEALCVSEATINNWKIAHPSFLESLNQGKRFNDNEVVEALNKRAKGFAREKTILSKDGNAIVVEDYYPPDATSCIFWLKNRQPKEWRDKTETVLSDPNGKGAFESMAIEIAKALAKGK